MTEEWFMLLLDCLPLLFWVWQKGGSCSGCYFVYHYCLRFDRGVVHVVDVILSTIAVYGLTEEWFILLLLYCLPLLFTVWQRSGSCCCYIVHHYSVRFDSSGSCFWCYIVYHWCLRFDRRGSCCGYYIFYHYCLMFDRWVVHVVVVILSTIAV